MHLDGEAVESVAVSLKSDDKQPGAKAATPSVRETLWWIPVVWRVLKWMRKRNRKRNVAAIRLRKNEEVIIRKKETPI